MEAVQVTPEQIRKMGDILTDTKQPISKRFRMIFTLRNIGGKEAIDALVPGAIIENLELTWCTRIQRPISTFEARNSIRIGTNV